jgi:hypothetical protein
MWNVVPDIYNVVTSPHIQASVCNWTCLRCYWRYVDKSMRLKLQTLCQIQRTSSRLRYVNCGPGHMQCSYICAYSVFSIQLNVSATLLEISRQFNVRYTANLEPYIAHSLQFILCGLWSRAYTMKWQHRIFSLQYSTERICAAIGGYLDNSMSVILQSWCQIQSTYPGLRYVSCGPGHIQCNYSYVYSGFKIQVDLYALLLEISRYFGVRYTANVVPNTAHTLQFTLPELWSPIYWM